MMGSTGSVWEKSGTEVFWGEIAPCDHLVQIYETDENVLDAIEGYVCGGLTANESVIIIATEPHLHALNLKLKARGYDLHTLTLKGLYIPLNAEDTLKLFMKNAWPDETLFNDFIKVIVTRARGNRNRKIRAYGEMVAVLWGQGHSGATVQLEHLWNKFRESEMFPLFCAYPRTGFTSDISTSINHICSAHTKVIAGNNPANQVCYQALEA